MRVVTRRRSEAPALMLARKYEVDGLLSWERVRSPEEVQSCQTPVQSVQAQVLGVPVFELVFALVDVRQRYRVGLVSLLSRGFGYI